MAAWGCQAVKKLKVAQMERLHVEALRPHRHTHTRAHMNICPLTHTLTHMPRKPQFFQSPDVPVPATVWLELHERTQTRTPYSECFPIS